MNGSEVSARDVVLRAPLKGMADAARSERAMRAFDSPAWEFYRGVEEAATGALYPNLALTKAEHWLDYETGAFREGFLSATTILDAAITAANPPARIPLPRFGE